MKMKGKPDSYAYIVKVKKKKEKHQGHHHHRHNEEKNTAVQGLIRKHTIDNSYMERESGALQKTSESRRRISGNKYQLPPTAQLHSLNKPMNCHSKMLRAGSSHADDSELNFPDPESGSQRSMVSVNFSAHNSFDEDHPICTNKALDTDAPILEVNLI
jgi:hypothetical protein